MIGSAAIAAWIALVAFWSLLAWGWATGELGFRSGVVFVVLWLAGNVALRSLDYSAMFPSLVAALDIGLVLIIFKGDVRIT